MEFIEIVKNVAAVIGLIISFFSVVTLCSDKAKKLIARVFNKYNQEQDNDIKELKEAVNSLTEKMDVLMENDKIVLDFTKQQCRDRIVEIYEAHQDTKQLPMREYKRLLYIEDIYITKLEGNSYASELITEMKTWKKILPAIEE